jgi:hypothetical protein
MAQNHENDDEARARALAEIERRSRVMEESQRASPWTNCGPEDETSGDGEDTEA